MPLAKNKINISVSIDKDVKELLEEYSHELDLSVSKFARNLIYSALDDFKILRVTGAIALSKTFGDILEKIPVYSKRLDENITSDLERSVVISVVIDAEVKKQLDKYAKEIGLPLNIFARNLIYVALQDFKLLKKVGLVKIAIAFKAFIQSFIKISDEMNTDKK